jgi:uncharacterized membrane protein
MTKKQQLISDLHFPLWLLKDFLWMADLPIFSLILAIPAILVALWICMMTAGKTLSENKMVLFWLIANTSWMISEKFDVNIMWISYLFFGIGIIEIIKYIKCYLKVSDGTH